MLPLFPSLCPAYIDSCHCFALPWLAAAGSLPRPFSSPPLLMLTEQFAALAQVLLIDLVLAGDNAIVVGMAAAGLPLVQRRRAIFWGMAAAVVLRIGFALVTQQLLGIVGLALAGGLLLLWVCWKLYRELRHRDTVEEVLAAHAEPKNVSAAIRNIIIADVSMSLDNVLAVAGAAQHHTWVLIVGLLLSVAFMGAAANFMAKVLQKHHWVAHVGLVVIAWVALRMVWHGGDEVLRALPIADWL